MFYEEQQINKYLLCPKCQTRFDEPKILPCGKIVCNNCILTYLDSVTTSNSKDFKCIVCTELHSWPRQEFPTCEQLAALLLEKPNDISRGEAADNLRQNIIDLQNQLDELNSTMQNGVDRIREYCLNLRNDVQLAIETKMNGKSKIPAEFNGKTINQINKSMIDKINNYEKECVEMFENDKSFQDKFDEMSNEITNFSIKWKNYIRHNKLNDNEMLKANHLAESFKLKLISEKKKVNDHLFNGGKFSKYVENFNKINENILGPLKKSHAKIARETISFKDLKRNKIANLLTDLNKSSPYPYPISIEFLENGSYFIVYQNKSYDLKYFTLAKEKSIEKKLKHAGSSIIKKHKNLIAFNFYFNGKSFLKILNQDLQRVKQINTNEAFGYNLILIGVNETNIFCTTNQSNQPLYILNWQLQLVNTIGQRDKSDDRFYFPSDIKQLEKRNGKFFWLNDTNLNILDGLTGVILKSIKISAAKFDFDSKNNLIVMCNSNKRLTHFDFNGQFIKEIELTHFPSTKFSFFIDNNDKLHFFDKLELNLLLN